MKYTSPSSVLSRAFRLLAAFLLSWQFSAGAAGTVTTASVTDLQNALAGGGLVRLAFDGTIVVTNTLTISNSATIDASGHNVTISGGRLRRIVTVPAGATFLVTNVVFANGINQGAAGANATDANAGSGGSGMGGAIYNQGTNGFVNCTFQNNSAVGGLGGTSYSTQGYNGGNGGAASGGAIYNLNTLVISNCTFAANSALGGDGGAGSTNYSLYTETAASGGVASGGAVYNAANATAKTFNCTFNNNTIISGDSGAPGLRSGFQGDDGVDGPTARGGAICNMGTNAIVSSTFCSNSVTGGNGGNGGISLCCTGGAGKNGGAATGGDIYSSAYIGVTNCTFAYGAVYGGAPGLGGSINGPNGAAGAASGADIYRTGTPVFLLANSILAYPVHGTCASGAITNLGKNLSSDATPALGTNGYNNTNPSLGALADNGGPTCTMSIPFNGVAVNNANSMAPLLDQRGWPRTSAPDIGAYEVTPTAYVYASGSEASEDGDVGVFIVEWIGAPQDFTITYAIGGSASNGVDYVQLPTSVSASATNGIAITRILVQPTGVTNSATKTVTLTLSNGSYGFDPAFSTATVTLFPKSNFNSARRFIRGTSTAWDFTSFVIPLDYQTGVPLDATAGNASTLFPGNAWTNMLYHFNCTNLSSQTTTNGRLAFENPIVAFGSPVGGSPLYLSRPYSFGISSGMPQYLSTALRIQAYYRSNSAWAGTISLALPDFSNAGQLGTYITNGFTASAQGYGLATTISCPPGVGWGNIYASNYFLTHVASASATNYYYVVEEQGGTLGTWMVLNASGGADWSKLYVMEFSPFPAGRSAFIDQPHFDGQPLPSAYLGAGIQEITNNAPTLPDLSYLAASNYLKINTSVELRRHPILDAFVKDMNNDPLALANYVINEIDLTDAIDYDTNYNSAPAINCGGINRGALATFQEGQGSPIEQCSLLIYLLRQAGVPAVYVFPPDGGLKMLDSQMSKLLHVQLRGALTESGRTNVPQMISVNYPWVAANVGGNWVHIFPWLKDTEISEGWDLYDFMPANYNNGYKWLTHFLANDPSIFSLSASDQPADLLPLFIQTNLDMSYPGVSVDDLGVQIINRRHLYARWTDFPKPFQLSGAPVAAERLGTNQNLFNTIDIRVYSQANPIRYIDTGEIQTMNLHNRKLMLRFTQVGSGNNHNMILTLAPYSSTITNVDTFSMADSTWKMSNSIALNSTDDTIVFQVTHRRYKYLPSDYVPSVFWASSNVWQYDNFEYGTTQSGLITQNVDTFRKGDLVTFCLDVGRVSEKMLNVQSQELQLSSIKGKTNAASLDPEVYQGTTAYLAGMSYFNYVNKFDDFISQLHKVQNTSRYYYGYGLLRPLRDATGALTNSGNVIPLLPALHMPENGQANLFNSSTRPDSGSTLYSTTFDWLLHMGLQQSAAEHGILRTFYQTNAISAVKLLQKAGTGTVALNRANYLSAPAAVQSADSQVWNEVVSFFAESDPNRVVFITPGNMTSGSFVGVGALMIGADMFASPVSGLNGGVSEPLAPSTFTSLNASNLTVVPAPDGSISPYVFVDGTPANDPTYLVDGASTSSATTASDLAASREHLDPTFVQAEPAIQQLYGGSVDASTAYAQVYDDGAVSSSLGVYNDASQRVYDPVSVLTGEFYINAVDLTLPGPLNLKLARNYSSQNVAENQFGFGWKPNYMPFLAVGTNSKVIYAAEMDGSVVAYRQTATNASLWLPTTADNPTLNNNSSMGIGSLANLFNNRLQLTSGTNVYTLTGADGSVRAFSMRSYQSGSFSRQRPYLDSWKDNCGNAFTFQYGTDMTQPDYGQLHRIQSSSGNFIVFYFDPFGHIIESASGDGRHTHYEYDKFGDLITVTLPDESQIGYTYQHLNSVTNSVTNVYSTHLLLQESKPDGRLIGNYYDSQRRVTNQWATVGGDLNPLRSASFVYSNGFSLSLPTNMLTGYTYVYDYTNRVTAYYYTNSLIRRIVDPSNQVVLQDWFETDTNGGYRRSLKSTTDKRGLQTAYAYDTLGNVTNTTVTGDLTGTGVVTNAITSAAYNTNCLPMWVTPPSGNQIQYVYSTDYPFLAQQIIQCAGSVPIITNYSFYSSVSNVYSIGANSYTNSAYGLLSRKIRAYGSVDAATNDLFYNAQGFATNSIQYSGTGDPNVVNQLFYNERGEMVQRTDAAGRVYLADYDPMGRRSLQETYEAGQSNPMDWTYWYYNENGELQWTDGPCFDPEDYVWQDYDGGGRKNQEIHWRSRGKQDGSGVEAVPGDGLYATTFYRYDPAGNLTNVVNPRGDYSVKFYDAMNRLRREEFYSAAGALLATNGFAYNAAGDVTNIYNGLGGLVIKQYTTGGRIKSQINADGSTNGWLYKVDGRPWREYQRNGAYWEFAYDDLNLATTATFYSASQVALATTKTVKDRRGNVIQRVDEAGNTFASSFDGLDRVKGISGPAITSLVPTNTPGTLPAPGTVATNQVQESLTYYYDAAGQTVTTVNALGEKTVKTTDAIGRIVNVSVFASGGVTPVRVSSIVYAANHHGFTVTEGTGANALSSTTYTDNDGRTVLTVRSPGGGQLDYVLHTFDVAGNRVESDQYTSTGGQPYRWTSDMSSFDGLGRCTGGTDHNNTLTVVAFDPAGNVTNWVALGIATNAQWSGTYSNSGQILADWDTGAGGQVTRSNTYTYYPSGNIWAGLKQTVTDGNSVTTTNSYDDWLRLSSITTTGSQGVQNITASWGFDPRGLVTNISQSYAVSNNGPATVVRRSYDAYRKLTNEVVTLDGVTVTAAGQKWDSAGRRTILASGSLSMAFQYRADGLMTGVNSNIFNYTDSGLLVLRSNQFRSFTLNQWDTEGHPLQATTVIPGQSTSQENWTWYGNGMPATYTGPRADYSDSRGFGYRTSDQRLSGEIVTLASGQTLTNNFVYDQNAASGGGVLTRAYSAQSDWNGTADSFSRINSDSNTMIRRPAWGRVNGSATLRGSLNGRSVEVRYDSSAASQWTSDLNLLPGTNNFTVYADHPSGQFTTNRSSTFTVSAGASDQQTNQFDGAGNVTTRTWKTATGQVVKTQTLTWDAFGQLVSLSQRDAQNNGFNLQAVFDGLGRQIKTIETTVSNNVPLAIKPQPLVTLFTYDPQAAFQVVRIDLTQGTSSRRDSLVYGPDMSGVYGGMHGVGGLEMVATTDDGNGHAANFGVINDSFGNVIGGITNGIVKWTTSRLGLYGPVQGYEPPKLSLNTPTYSSLAWRTRPVTPANTVLLGARHYDYSRYSFLGADPLGHGSDPMLNTAFAGNPAVKFDPTGLCAEQTTESPREVLSYGGVTRYADGSFDVDIPGVITMSVPADEGRAMFNEMLDRNARMLRGFADDMEDTFLNVTVNAGAIKESWHEVRHPDFSSGWGYATFGVGVVSLTANVVDAAVNVITLGGEGAAKNTLKAGVKDASETLVKGSGRSVERGLYSTTAGQGMESGLFERIQNSFQRKGGVMKADEESTRLVNSLGVEGITFDTATIVLPKNPSTSAVYEELIHTAQLRRGMTDVRQMEIEAAQKLIRFGDRYRIPSSETQQTMQRLNSLLNNP